MNITRDNACALLKEYVKSGSLIRHCLSVEAAMKAYAKKYNGDVEKWGITGLLHDFDYEAFSSLEKHPFEGCKILKEKEYPEDVIQAILGHGNHTGVGRESQMAKCLFAVDELCGFIVALAHVRPGKLKGMSAKSVKKNLKKKGFAAAISREEIEQGISELGIDRDEHIDLIIQALQGISKELGLCKN